MVVRFSTFRHRTLFCRNRNKLKNARVRLDLTKKWCGVFADAIDFVRACRNVDCVMVGINCRLKVVFRSGRSGFLDSVSDLKDLVVGGGGRGECCGFLEHGVFTFIYWLLIIDFGVLNEQTCFIEMISKINFFMEEVIFSQM